MLRLEDPTSPKWRTFKTDALDYIKLTPNCYIDCFKMYQKMAISTYRNTDDTVEFVPMFKPSTEKVCRGGILADDTGTGKSQLFIS